MRALKEKIVYKGDTIKNINTGKTFFHKGTDKSYMLFFNIPVKHRRCRMLLIEKSK